MVFESADHWPSVEGDERRLPPPRSAYGFQKLAVEYFARAAWEQYGLPFTIVRPFNCVGIGEGRALRSSETTAGGIELAMSHVVPDLIQKVLKGQDPLPKTGRGVGGPVADAGALAKSAWQAATGLLGPKAPTRQRQGLGSLYGMRIGYGRGDLTAVASTRVRARRASGD